jgi:hypothetical protein
LISRSEVATPGAASTTGNNSDDDEDSDTKSSKQLRIDFELREKEYLKKINNL